MILYMPLSRFQSYPDPEPVTNAGGWVLPDREGTGYVEGEKHRESLAAAVDALYPESDQHASPSALGPCHALHQNALSLRTRFLKSSWSSKVDFKRRLF